MEHGSTINFRFDGYNPRDHLTVVFDEFYGWLPYHQLLELCDRYGVRVQIKGGTCQFRPACLVFTSNSHPTKWYKYEHFSYDPLERRIDFMFRHFRVDVVNQPNFPGLEVDQLIIEVQAGTIGAHPLRKYCEPYITKEDHYIVDEQAIINEFAPRPTHQAVLDALAGVIDYNRDGTFLQLQRDNSSSQDSSFHTVDGSEEVDDQESEDDSNSQPNTYPLDFEDSDGSAHDDVRPGKKLKH